jgi:4-amino-4-deoxy-L-arabinose transferase-like glycosyltransferase
MKLLSTKLDQIDVRWLMAAVILIFFAVNAVIGIRSILCRSVNPLMAESSNIYTIQKTMLDTQIYSNPEQPPFELAQKTPFFYILSSTAARILGLRANSSFFSIIFVARLLSLSASLIISSLMFWICHRLFKADWLTSLATGFLAFLIPSPFYFLSRADAWAGLFFILTFSMCLLALDKSRWWHWLIAGAFGWMAFLTKQHGLLAFIIPFLFLLIERRFKPALFLAGGFFIGFALTSLIFAPYYNIIPGPTNFLYDNIIKGLDNGILVERTFRQVYSVYLRDYGLILFLTLFAMIYQLVTRKFKQIHIHFRFLSFTFILLTGGMSISALKSGSDINYLTESLLVSTLIIVLLLQDIFSKLWFKNYRNLVTAILAGSLIFLMLALTLTKLYTYSYSQAITCFQPNRPDKMNLIRFMKQELSDHPDTFLFTNDQNFNIFFVGQMVFPQLDASRTLNTLHTYNYKEFRSAIESGKVRYLVLNEHDPEMQYSGVEFTGFIELNRLDGYIVYINSR